MCYKNKNGQCINTEFQNHSNISLLVFKPRKQLLTSDLDTYKNEGTINMVNMEYMYMEAISLSMREISYLKC